MNRNCYRLVFSRAAGMMVPRAETSRSQSKAGQGATLVGAVLASVVLANPAMAELPVASVGGAVPNFVTYGSAAYQMNGNQAFINQVGDKSILNWKSFNVSAGNTVQFRQVDSLAAGNLVQGAAFTSLNRIWDANPSVIAGMLTQGVGQKGNVILVNANGIAFMGGAQVDLNSFTASTLNIADDFITKSFLTSNTTTPQFEKDLLGGEGRGFVKVFEGARITAGSQGRVMLIAPTVVNKGVVSAPDGQVIAGAGTKVFLRSASGADDNVRGLLVEVDSTATLSDFNSANADVKDGLLDGKAVSLTESAIDKLGHVTNLGELTSAHGNVTMVGYAVNQRGVARASTSVVANGSVYLLAKDRATNNAQSLRGGRVILGAGSLTEVVPDLTDTTTTVDAKDEAGNYVAGLSNKSQVQVVGLDIRMAGGATVNAPSGEVSFVAMDNPSLLRASGDPFVTAQAAASATARVHIASDARINVAGLESVKVSVARNSVEVELRGDELKDSPANRTGPLRGEKVYVDINRALANANSGKATLIAKDSLESYQGRLERSVAERSTAGGTVSIRSQGEAIVESGAVVDLSGGSLVYTPGLVKTTLLVAGGKFTDLADAVADVRYDSIATRYKMNFDRWNRSEVIDLGQSLKFDAGYTEGKNAGTLNLMGLGALVMKADVQGRTTVGELQREAGTRPMAATLRLGTDAVGGDYKLNQRIDFTSTAATLPAGFGFGDVLPAGMRDTLEIDPALFGENKVGIVQAFSNNAAVVRNAMRMTQGGSVAITAKGIQINADVLAAGGKLTFNSRDNNVDTAARPLHVAVADGVALVAHGGWANDLVTASDQLKESTLVNGGAVTLSSAGDVVLGTGTLIDVMGGARVKPGGKITNGSGGSVTLDAGVGASAAVAHTAAVKLGGDIKGYALGKGGMLSINTAKIQIGGNRDETALNLDAGFVARGGFANFKLTGRDGVTVASGEQLTPTVQSLEFEAGYQLNATNTPIETFTRIEKRVDRQRQAANLTLTADSTLTGNVMLDSGSAIQADDLAVIALNAGNRIDVRGEIRTVGGTITATLNPAPPDDGEIQKSTLWLGPQAKLDVAGIARTYTDKDGRQAGTVLSGGTVTLNAGLGFVVTETGSLVNVSGAAPSRLDVLNESGGLGRMVGSDAGTVNIVANEGILLDGQLRAQAGSPANRGGAFSLRYVTIDDVSINGAPLPPERVLSIGLTVAPQVLGTNITAGSAATLIAQAKVGTAALESGGFDTLSFRSHNAIRLEDGLNLGANRPLALREVLLDTPRIEMTAGKANLTAHTVRVGNLDAERQAVVNAPATGAGVFTANAQLLELMGNQTFTGLASAALSGTQDVRLSGVTTAAQARPFGALKTAGNLTLLAGVIAPSTYSDYTIDASGHNVAFTRLGNTSQQPLSALGSLTVKAKDIQQGGQIWAPFGQLDFQASDSVTFYSGSLTSVAAEAGSVLPFGKTENGRSWVYDINGTKIAVETLLAKSIRMTGASVDMQAGATIDLAGGGDLQAYEFTVGPGGSRDILSDKNTYAILPTRASGFSPRDAQESLDHASGESVYLSGVEGLADGVYTLLPAHYALLPGALAVRLETGIKNLLPGQSYTRQDGVRVAAGYLTDNRANAPKDATWSGIEVLTNEHIRARSEVSLSQASVFLSGTKNRPQDGGLLAIASSGAGSSSIKLDASYRLGAGVGGQGGAVDISAPSIVIVGGSVTGLSSNAAVLDAEKLNSMGASSLFIGGSRSAAADSTSLTVGANTVTVATDAAHAMKASEIILAARDTLTVKSGSVINAQGVPSNQNRYTTAGEGALLIASASGTSFSRTGNPGTALGTLIGEAGSKVIAADSIILDATKDNAFKGAFEFSNDGSAVAGSLAVGASRINFGAPPLGANGLTFGQSELEALSSLASMTLNSYSTFNIYGDVKVGGVDALGKATLQNLTLQGAGLAGISNAGQTALLRAKNLTLANPAGVAFVAGGALGTGQLGILADTLTLGSGDKSVRGFNNVSVVANELIGNGVGTTDSTAPVSIEVSRLSGNTASSQSFGSDGTLRVLGRASDRILTDTSSLGAKWSFSGTNVDFSTHAALESGELKLTANTGDLNLGAGALVDVTGREVAFFDVTSASAAGRAELVSKLGNITVSSGAQVDVSGARGGDAGTLVLTANASGKKVSLANGSVVGTSTVDGNGLRGDGGVVQIDTGLLASNFADLNATLNSGGFNGERTVRVRSGDLEATGSTVAKTIKLSADNGKLSVSGTLDASGAQAGRIELFANDDLTIAAGSQLKATSSAAGKEGGDIEIGSNIGKLALKAGSAIDVSGGVGGGGGKVLLRAARNTAHVNKVNVSELDSTIEGASNVSLEAVKVYSGTTMTLNASATNTATTLGLTAINTENTSYASNFATIKNNLGPVAQNSNFHVLSGVEIRSSGDMTLGADWNLLGSRAGGEAGVLTLRSEGKLNVNNNLSDGFNVATQLSGTAPATLQTGSSWSYRLVAGADRSGANPLATKPGVADLTIAAAKKIRTGTGDIRLASGRDIKFTDNVSGIYTAGQLTPVLAGFTAPANAQFSQDGGDISLMAVGDIKGDKRSTQLYSNWLFRQGRTTNDLNSYLLQPAWWVRFDQFAQGVGALGGGNVSLQAGGKIENISASTPTQAYMASTTPDANQLNKTGGGNVLVKAAGDLLGGQYYADNGELVVKVGGSMNSGERVGTGASARPLYTLLALGDAKAKVQAQGEANVHAIINPHLMVQSSGVGGNFNIANAASAGWALFSTYGSQAGASISSTTGNVNLLNITNTSTTTVAGVRSAYSTPLSLWSTANYNSSLLSYLPPSLSAVSYQGNVALGGTQMILSPAAKADLTILAANSISVGTKVVMSDMDVAKIPDSLRPSISYERFNPALTSTAHAVVPVHESDTVPVRIYAVEGDVTGTANTLNLALPKAVMVRAGNDVKDLGLTTQHVNPSNSISRVEAGRDVLFTEGSSRRSGSYIWVGGPGRLEVTAGRDIDLGTSAGIVSRGGLDNVALPKQGADVNLTAGFGESNIDYSVVVDRLIEKLSRIRPVVTTGSADDATLWQARWLTGSEALTPSNALAAVKAVDALDSEGQRSRVREMIFSALRTTGRDSNDSSSPYAATYERGYAALELVFPGIAARRSDGTYSNYQGQVNLFASRVVTERGGNIEFMVPGDGLVVGLTNTRKEVLATQKFVTGNEVGLTDSGPLGLVTVESGDIRGFARKDVLVNQSRILSVGGGDILLWSSEGDIDAGKGKKTATSVPAPIVRVDSQGNVTQELQGAASGSGIGALSSSGIKAGDVDLIAPKGTVNAGDAGIRAGNLNIAAQTVLGADNISVSGTSTGTPIADTSVSTAAASGATSSGDDSSKTTATLSQSAANAAQSAQALKDAFKPPSIVRVDVLGFGQ